MNVDVVRRRFTVDEYTCTWLRPAFRTRTTGSSFSTVSA
jgi:hypothetical protein